MEGTNQGGMEVFTREETYPEPDWLNFLHTLAGQAAITIDNAQLFKNLQRSNQELILAYDTTLAGWGKALELRDKETQGHTDRVSYLRPALDIPYAHHERWDGSGYPRGLKGKDLPIAARIFTVVDIWDALLYKRVYSDAWPEEKVFEYLKNTAGIELDPDIVENFLELLEEERYKNKAN